MKTNTKETQNEAMNSLDRETYIQSYVSDYLEYNGYAKAIDSDLMNDAISNELKAYKSLVFRTTGASPDWYCIDEIEDISSEIICQIEAGISDYINTVM